MSYIGNVGDSNTSINSDFSKYTYEYIATAGQTTFTGTDINSAVLGYTVGNIIVSYGGADLAFSDYTATNGTSVVLADGALVGKILRVVAFEAFELADAYTKTQIDANTYTRSQANTLLDAKLDDSQVGTTANKLIALDGTAKLPAVDGSQLTGLVGGGPSLGTSSVIRTNAKVIDENITFTGNENGSSVGPITVAAGRVITVASGSTWVVL
jgi:hypothetical protein